MKQKRNKTIHNQKFYRWAITTFENSRSKLPDKMLYGPSCNVEQIHLNCKYFVNIIRSLTTDRQKAFPSTLQLIIAGEACQNVNDSRCGERKYFFLPVRFSQNGEEIRMESKSIRR